MHLGDTLKINLTIPDTIEASSINGGSENQIVRSVQESFYAFTFYYIDTITRAIQRLSGSNTVITIGYGSGGILIYTTNTVKPFRSLLNLIPPYKGLYYIEITPQPGSLKINNSFEAGLAVNFAVTDKHWVENAAYFNGPNQPDFITSVTQANEDGYGFYVFRVNWKSIFSIRLGYFYPSLYIM